MNVLDKFISSLIRSATGLAPETIEFWQRLVMLLVLPVIAAAWTFRRGYRSVFVQACAAVLGVLAALSLPLEKIQIQSGLARVWFLAFAVTLVGFLPFILPSLLFPTLGAQQQLRKALLAAVVAIILANLLWG